jgi:hypothetical protein
LITRAANAVSAMDTCYTRRDGAGMARRRRSEYEHADRIARRLVHAKAQPSPYTDDHPQYLKLHGERDGEVRYWGLPLRAHRMFPTKSRSRAHRLATDFAAFAATADQSDWRVWTIHYPSRKTEISNLVVDLEHFNKRINSVFGQLRKHCQFELLLLGIHIDWNHSTGLFDIHAHFVCKIPGVELREKARRRLMSAFSRADTSDEKLRTAYGFAIYAFRTFKLSRVARWHRKALLAGWDLINHDQRYARTGKLFATWRRLQPPLMDAHQKQAAQQKRANRKATRYESPVWQHRDRPLVRKIWKIGDENVLGTLFRSARANVKHAGPHAAAAPNKNSSAFVDTTQSWPEDQRASASARQVSTLTTADAGQSCDFAPCFGLAGFDASMAAKVYGCNRIERIQVTPARSNDMSNYVTRVEVHAAADRVDADGKKPSAPAVRQIIGRGSNSTIFEHLKTWVPRDQRLELPPIPDVLSNAVSALTADFWHMVLNLAGEETAKRIAQATADTEEAQAAAAQIGDRADRLATDLETALERVTQLEKLVAEQNVQIAASQKYADDAHIQNVELTAEINTLRRTLSQFAPTAGETRKSTKQQKANAGDDARPVA